MVSRQYFRLIGSGTYLPDRLVTAAETDRRIGMPSGWTMANVGVETRYECLAPETLISMGTKAIERALAEAQIGWHQVDLLLDCSACRFRPIPCNAAHYSQIFAEQIAKHNPMVSSHQGPHHVPCFDVQSTCLGFAVALNVANSLMASGGFKQVVIVASEAGMAGLNWQQPESAALIGDGAAAVVLRYDDSVQHPMVFGHETMGQYLEHCRIDGGGHYLPPYDFNPQDRAPYCFDMNGPAVFRTALKYLPELVERVCQAWGGNRPLQVLPHQASPKALELIRQKLGYPESQFHRVVGQVGNLIAASMPFVLDHCRKSGSIQSGDSILLLGTSAGYSQAVAIWEL